MWPCIEQGRHLSGVPRLAVIGLDERAIDHGTLSTQQALGCANYESLVRRSENQDTIDEQIELPLTRVYEGHAATAWRQSLAETGKRSSKGNQVSLLDSSIQ